MIEVGNVRQEIASEALHCPYAIAYAGLPYKGGEGSWPRHP